MAIRDPRSGIARGRMRYIGTIHRAILDALPGTDKEIAAKIGYSHARVTCARNDLVALNLVRCIDTRDPLPNDGRRPMVWGLSQ